MRILLELAGWRREFTITEDQWRRRRVDVDLSPPFEGLAPSRTAVRPRYDSEVKYRFSYHGQDMCSLPIFTCE